MRSPMSRVQFIRSTAVQMMGSYIVLILFAFLVEGVFGEVMSVMEGNRVSLNTGVTKNPGDIFRWYFEDTLIAQINGHPNTSCLYYGKGEKFKDRLEVDYETGSLIITNITSEHTGRYEAEFIEGKPGKTETIIRSSKFDPTKIYPKISDLVIHKSFILTVSDLSSGEKNGPSLAVPGSGLSPGAVPGIVVFAVLLLLAAAVGGVMIYRRRSSRNDTEKNKQNMPDQVSEEKLVISEEHDSSG